MLKELSIKNFILIKDQHINFHNGLNVISGDTGAGKSIILQALGLILGVRPKASFVRKGEKSFEVSAIFDLSTWDDEQIKSFPDIAQSSELLISRQMTSDGKGKVYINGSLVTVSILESVTSKLMSICGQGEHVALLNPSFHVDMIDIYAGLSSKLKAYQVTYQSYTKLKNEIEEIKEKSQERALKKAQLSFTVEELSKLALDVNLRENLDSEIKQLENAYSIIESANEFNELLMADDGILVKLSTLQKVSSRLSKFSSKYNDILESIGSIDSILSDTESVNRNFLSSIEIDDIALEEKRSKLSELARVERKYNLNTQGLVALLENSQKELLKISSSDNLEELVVQLSIIKEKLVKQASELSKQRKKASKELSKALCEELKELNMKSVNFELKQTKSDFGLKGDESLEFLISTNRGEDLKPLRKIASGGELSRITLVIKKLLKEKHGVSVLIFDEVDTGISGGVARAVGEKLKDLSVYSQVICITHLAQVASLGDVHFLVKKTEGSRTVTEIEVLEEDARIEEIARMLAGYKLTDASRESARELLSS